MQTTTQKGFFTSEFWTMVLANVVGLLLVSGKITQSVAQDINAQAPVIVGAFMCVLSALGYMASRFFLKTKYGPQQPNTMTPEAPTPHAPVSPSFAPTSTGPAADSETDAPMEAV